MIKIKNLRSYLLKRANCTVRVGRKVTGPENQNSGAAGFLSEGFPHQQPFLKQESFYLTYDQNGQAVVNYTITNHGLIATDNLTMGFDNHRDYTIKPLVEKLGQIKAMSTMIVPVTVTKLVLSQKSPLMKSVANSVIDDALECFLAGTVNYIFICDIIQHRYNLILALANSMCSMPAIAQSVHSGFGPGGSGSGADNWLRAADGPV